MKKIFLFFIILPCVANAANMCVKDDAMVIVLDPQIGGTALSSDASTKTWSTKFSYGVISGIGGCYNNVGSPQGVVASDQTNITPDSTGYYCYCKMLRPIESPWVYGGLTSISVYTPSLCASSCASSCSSYAASVVALRAGLFNNPVQ